MTTEERDEIYQNMSNECIEKQSIIDYAAYLELSGMSHIPDNDINDIYILLWENLCSVKAEIEYNLERLISVMIDYQYNSESDYDVIKNIILIIRYGNYLYDNIFVSIQCVPIKYTNAKKYAWDYVSDVFTDDNIQEIYNSIVESTPCFHDKVPKKHNIDIHDLIYDTRIYIMWFLYTNAPTKFAQHITDLIHDIPTVLI